jgi:hypothetical protein
LPKNGNPIWDRSDPGLKKKKKEHDIHFRLTTKGLLLHHCYLPKNTDKKKERLKKEAEWHPNSIHFKGLLAARDQLALGNIKTRVNQFPLS